jgi:hypothetical protein
MKLWIWPSKCSFIFRKILRRGADGWTSSEGRRAADFLSPLKIHHSQASLNQRTLGPAGRTLTTRPRTDFISQAFQNGRSLSCRNMKTKIIGQWAVLELQVFTSCTTWSSCVERNNSSVLSRRSWIWFSTRKRFWLEAFVGVLSLLCFGGFFVVNTFNSMLSCSLYFLCNLWIWGS